MINKHGHSLKVYGEPVFEVLGFQKKEKKKILTIIEPTVCLVGMPDKQKDNYNYKGNCDGEVLLENKRA